MFRFIVVVAVVLAVAAPHAHAQTPVVGAFGGTATCDAGCDGTLLAGPVGWTLQASVTGTLPGWLHLSGSSSPMATGASCVLDRGSALGTFNDYAISLGWVQSAGGATPWVGSWVRDGQTGPAVALPQFQGGNPCFGGGADGWTVGGVLALI